MLRWQYAHGKLSEALGSMSASSETLAKRLANAYVAYLVVLKAQDFPEELRERFELLYATVTTQRARWEGEGSVEATVSQMHPRKVKELIREIASLEYLLAQVYDD